MHLGERAKLLKILKNRLGIRLDQCFIARGYQRLALLLGSWHVFIFLW
jgi:hypothetical protein